MSTILFGSTVEFEMAILTMAFLGGGEVCPLPPSPSHTLSRASVLFLSYLSL